MVNLKYPKKYNLFLFSFVISLRIIFPLLFPLESLTNAFKKSIIDLEFLKTLKKIGRPNKMQWLYILLSVLIVLGSAAGVFIGYFVRSKKNDTTIAQAKEEADKILALADSEAERAKK